MNEPPFHCTTCGRRIGMYKMHYFVGPESPHLVCGKCIHDCVQPVLVASQTRQAAHRYLGTDHGAIEHPEGAAP